MAPIVAFSLIWSLYLIPVQMLVIIFHLIHFYTNM